MSSAPVPSSPPLDVRQEVRLAVVMYGGVSLAIYINGIAQELLQLVEATAASADDANQPLLAAPTSTARVYRQLAQLLGTEGREAREPSPSSPIRTRFVIDILSGTSAGGINAIFLAKALANNQPMKQLQDLWIRHGDIDRLINDAHTGTRPTSLLDSNYMFAQLHHALDGMDSEAPGGRTLANELDLFITATDLRGLPIALRLADGIAEERRHRHVFHLRCTNTASETTNDFTPANNRFLAYIARCTSAFPVAFDPMTLQAAKARQQDIPAWENQFFATYRQALGDPGPVAQRPFADGGYLDNKPFSYATATLGTRRANVPVDRKLIYIEPSPERINKEAPTGAPTAVESATAALFLARYETIREDLQQILLRNRLIERVERIIGGLEEDLAVQPRPRPITREDFAESDLREMIAAEGVGYGGYHRLKIATLTDDITRLIARALEYDDESDEFLAIRYLVRAWRDQQYAAYMTAGSGKRTQNAFLVRFDLAYRIRRATFVLDKTDQLACLDRRAKELLETYRGKMLPADEGERHDFRASLATLRQGFNQVLRRLLQARDALAVVGAANPLATTIQQTAITRDELKQLLAPNQDADRMALAHKMVSTRAREFATLEAHLAEHIRAATEEAAARADQLLTADEAAPLYARVAVDVIGHYYRFYDRYDLIAYPIQYSTAIGEETDHVDVIRISPQDAPTLIDEQNPNEPRRKLAGTTLMNFGAFLHEPWRRNDLLWGRLDAAERLITSLLANSGHAAQAPDLIRQAHEIILGEELKTNDNDQVCQVLADTIMATAPTDRVNPTGAKRRGPPLDPTLTNILLRTLRAALNPSELRQFFARSYEVDRQLNPTKTARTMARATHVIGKMLEGLADTYRAARRPGMWLARLGRISWSFVEVAVPGSIHAIFARHWLTVLYLLETGLIVGGAFFANRAIQQFGLTTLGITLAAHVTVLLLRDYIRGRRAWLRALLGLLALAVLLLALVGAVRVFDLNLTLGERRQATTPFTEQPQ